MDDLRECPFCGGEAHYSVVSVKCFGCNAVMAGVQGKELTITAWNTRADTERVKVLEDALRHCRDMTNVWQFTNEIYDMEVGEELVECLKDYEKTAEQALAPKEEE